MTKNINLFITFLFTILFCVSVEATDEKTGGSVEKTPSAPLNGGPRNWVVKKDVTPFLNLRKSPSTGSKILDSYRPGAILYNIDGCMAGDDGLVWCSVQKLEGGTRGYVVLDYIKPASGPDGVIPTGFDDSPVRAGEKKYDAKGQIKCARRNGQPAEECSFGVARSAGGYATVVINKPDGSARAIFFSLGIPVGVDKIKSDTGDFRYSRENGLNIIFIGDERYEIPDAVILGKR